MTLRQAMQAPDTDKFWEGIQQEFNDHCEREHWAFVLRSSIPPGTKVLPSVWAMRHKCHIATSEVYKWKAHLNIHGGHQIKGIHYWDTYSPMVHWASIWLALALSIIHGWHTAQMDFVLAYPQADIEVPLFMEIPKGFDPEGWTGPWTMKKSVQSETGRAHMVQAPHLPTDHGTWIHSGHGWWVYVLLQQHDPHDLCGWCLEPIRYWPKNFVSHLT